jgi:hypothetical protein
MGSLKFIISNRNTIIVIPATDAIYKILFRLPSMSAKRENSNYFERCRSLPSSRTGKTRAQKTQNFIIIYFFNNKLKVQTKSNSLQLQVVDQFVVTPLLFRYSK